MINFRYILNILGKLLLVESAAFLLCMGVAMIYGEDDANAFLISAGITLVAACILIFSYQRREGFPMDVWMKKVMAEYYPGKDASYFHPYEALSQQYLFSWIRSIT